MRTHNSIKPLILAISLISLTACKGGGGGGGGSSSGGWDSGCDSFYNDCGGGSGDWGGGGWDDDDDDGGWGGGDDGGWGGGDDDDDDGGDTYCDGTGFCYKEGNPLTGRDTVAQVGQEEVNRIAVAGKKFAAKFQLSEQTGLSVAKAFYDYKELSKRRTRTRGDLEKFTKRLYGMEMSRITNSIEEMEKGNLAPMTAAIEDAAEHWGTTPETMREVLTDWYQDYLK